MGPFLILQSFRAVGAAMTENVDRIRAQAQAELLEEFEGAERQIREEIWAELLEQFERAAVQIERDTRAELMESLAAQLAKNGQGVRDVELVEDASTERRIRGEARAELLEDLAAQLAEQGKRIKEMEPPDQGESDQSNPSALADATGGRWQAWLLRGIGVALLLILLLYGLGS